MKLRRPLRPLSLTGGSALFPQFVHKAGKVVLSGTFSKYAAPLASKNPATKAKDLAEIEIEKNGAATKQEIEVAVENPPALGTFKRSWTAMRLRRSPPASLASGR